MPGVDAARRAAFDAIDAVLRQGAYIHLAAKQHFHALSALDRRFAGELLFGTVDKIIPIDAALEPLLQRRVAGKIKTVLRMGAYQILYLDRVPHHASCSASVDLTRQIGKGDSAGFVNAVLRKLTQTLQTPQQNFAMSPQQALSLQTALPEWMITLWQQQIPQSQWQDLIAYQGYRHLPIRANTFADTNAQHLAAQLDNKGIAYHFGRLQGDAILVEHAADVLEDDVFYNHLAVVQGEASQFLSGVVERLSPKTLWDCCGAPGGKSSAICSRLNGQVDILVCDVHEHRVQLIESLIAAHNLPRDRVKARLHDAMAVMDGLFDVVLADVPCSALGTVFSHPDVKLRQTYDTVCGLAVVQQKILDNVCRNVKPGGYLVYSTCTLTDQENAGQVRRFIDTHPEFEPTNEFFGAVAADDQPWLQILPYQYDTDGFFIAVLKRVCV